MPRLKSYRRSLAAKRRMAAKAKADVTFEQSDATSAHRGTGERHRSNKWPTSLLTGRRHKLVIPSVVPGNKFVLIVGDSHLRAIADGIVRIPGKNVSFGIMSTHGADAHDLRTELIHAVLPRCPDAVCLLAPSNNLTASKTVTEAGADFADLITSACRRWPKVFVLDFPPRLTIEMVQQDLMRNEFCRVAAQMGVTYFSTSQYFPLTDLKMWSRDGVHLSDVGMPILAQLMCSSSYVALDETSSNPWVPTYSPKLVVMEEESATCPPVDPSAVLMKCFVPTCHPDITSMGEVVSSECCSEEPLESVFDTKVFSVLQ
ncbi:uncharacterized protein [Pempheris klunzingeri]|uniref:uncharacterized protein n=1 Tax=Pempheris klunzingeri TaxID=3127111 RepID=UPI0039818EE0